MQVKLRTPSFIEAGAERKEEKTAKKKKKKKSVKDSERSEARCGFGSEMTRRNIANQS